LSLFITKLYVYYSTNLLEITAALVAVCKLVTEDMIPAVITDVLNLLNHEMEAVRKKAVSALHRFYQMDKRSVLDHVDKIRRILCDRGKIFPLD
jgi:AP-4 complex subunit epsilon-1